MINRTSQSTPHIVLGAGVAGLSAAYHLAEPYRIFEAQPEIGGVAGSVRRGGFTFDHAIHVLYTKDPYASKLIRTLLKDNFIELERSSWVYSRGMFTAYPYQAHTYGLPDEVIRENLQGLLEARYGKDEVVPENFEEWILATFGKGIAKNFMLPFNKKVWAADLSTMGFSWIADRVTRLDIKQISDGAYSPLPIKYGPNAKFWYPKHGGMSALPNAFMQNIGPVRNNMRCAEIDAEQKLVTFENGEKYSYRTLISTLPIPKLASLLCDVIPISIQEQINTLRSNRVITVNLGIARANISDKHWIYFPEEDIEFHRISFPSNFSDDVAPAGASSIMAEFSESASRPINRRGIIERTIAKLTEIGIIGKSDKIIFSEIFEIDPAYIVPAPGHEEAISEIQSYLRSLDIFSCGRFGEWMYFNMDQSILSGKQAAELAMQKHFHQSEMNFAKALI